MLEDDVACSYFWSRLYAKVSIIRGTLTITFRIHWRPVVEFASGIGGMLFHEETIRGILWASRKCAYTVRTIEAALFSLVPRLRFSEILREIASRNAMVIKFLFAFASRFNFQRLKFLILSKFSLEIFEEIWGKDRKNDEKYIGMLILALIGSLFAFALRFNDWNFDF